MRGKTAIGILFAGAFILYLFRIPEPMTDPEYPMESLDAESSIPSAPAGRMWSRDDNRHHSTHSTQLSSGMPSSAERKNTFGLPPGLKPVKLVAEETQHLPDNRIVSHRIISTASKLGRILAVETVGPKGNFTQHTYSADHLVVSTPDAAQITILLKNLQRSGFEVKTHLQDYGILHVVLHTDSPAEIYEQLETAKEYAEPLGIAELDGVGSAGLIPNDSSYHLQWHHQNINSELAWNYLTGSSSISVAVLDTGVNAIQELSGRVLSGYDFVNLDADASDDQGHGTAVAATIAATGNNNSQLAGVDWNCGILPIKILDDSGFGLYSWWASGIQYARSNGADIMNLSAGGTSDSATLTSAIDAALADGMIFITITHNDGTGTIRYPGRLPQAISVGSTTSSDIRSSFSNWGPNIDLVAPGSNVQTLNSSGNLTIVSGTSFAAPLVAGAAALLLSFDPSLDQDSMAALLVGGADDQIGNAQDTPGFDQYYGWGRLNIYNSLLLSEYIFDPVPVNITGHQVLPEGFVIQWTPEFGKKSRVKYTTSIEHTAFTNLSEKLAYPQNSYTDTVDHAEGKCFYTVELVVP